MAPGASLAAAGLLLLGGGTGALGNDRVRFDAWKREHLRQYATAEEEASRFANFQRTLRDIPELAAANPLATFAPDEWADWTDAEFAGLRGLSPPPNDSAPVSDLFGAADVARAEAGSNDWRDKGAVTPVKNQGRCGSCWSFSSTGNMEGQWFLAGNTLTSLSEQELVSCYANNGCGGGWMDAAFKWVVSNGGVASEASYPYTSSGGSSGKCSTTKSKTPAAKFTGHTMLPKNEGQILTYMQKNGPVAIALYAAWKSYKSGIMTSCSSSHQIDHAILIVGYGTSGSTPYWIIKNSWGTSFGEKGYIRLKYGTNQCNLLAGRPVSIEAGPPSPPRYHCGSTPAYQPVTKWAVNMTVWVESPSKADRECTVVEVTTSQVKIHYVGYDSSYDELVDKDSKRILGVKTEVKKCMKALEGHSTMALCKAACNSTAAGLA